MNIIFFYSTDYDLLAPEKTLPLCARKKIANIDFFKQYFM